LLMVTMCASPGFAQSTPPSLTLGPHELRMGLLESEVLDQLGTDLILRKIPKDTGPASEFTTITPPESNWAVQKDLAGVTIVLGQVGFTNHQLVSVSRNWDVKTTSARSLFSALNLATKDLEEEGFKDCKISTVDRNYRVNKGGVTAQQIDLNCGVKGITISLAVSDAPNFVSTSMHVREWMRDVSDGGK
jgi:hypothetical protein